MHRFGKHFGIRTFLISPYKIKKLVENCLALEYKGYVVEHERESFKNKYYKFYEEF